LALGNIYYYGGWASFTGKCTYMRPVVDGEQVNVGNNQFLVYVEDWGNHVQALTSFG